jgi:uncharacterized protein
MDGIKINKKPKLRKPYLIVAWPGMGEVAFKSAMYLADKLKAEEFAQISSEEFFYLTGSAIREGILNLPELPQGKFFYWKNPAAKRGGSANDLIIFVSNAQPDLARAQEYSKQIIEVAKTFGAEAIVSIAAMPQAIDHTQESRLWFASTSREMNAELKKYDMNELPEGQISGMNGLFLAIAKKEGFKGFCLLGEIPLYTIHIENPKAILSVLTALARILNIRLDFSDLREQAHVVEGEINKLLDFFKLGPQGQGPIGEEEIEKIKKTLSQLTKLPGSVKEKIEKLFKDAGTDISKANELKGELDRWNIYKEYEDRFLDLFKKKKDRDN